MLVAIHCVHHEHGAHIITKITDILDLWVLHYELPHRVRRYPEESTGEEHGNDAWDPAENAQRPRLSHNSEADCNIMLSVNIYSSMR